MTGLTRKDLLSSRRIGVQKKEPASGHSPFTNHFGQLTLSVGSLRPATDISRGFRVRRPEGFPKIVGLAGGS